MATQVEAPIEIRSIEQEGHLYYTVEGLPVRERPSDDTPLTAALRMVSRLVRQESGPQGEREAVFCQEGQPPVHYLVRATGEYEEINDGSPTTTTTPPTSSAAAEEVTGWRPQEPPPPRKRATKKTPRRGRGATAVQNSSTSKWPAVFVAGAAAICLGAAGMVYLRVSGDAPAADQQSQQNTAAPVQGAPLGYDPTPRWVSGPLTAEVPPVITLEGEAVTLENGGALIARTVQGTQLWSHTLGIQARQVAVRSVAGTRSAVVVSDSRIQAFAMDNGRQLLDLELPAGSTVSLVGPAPMVASPGKATSVQVITGRKLTDVPIPSGLKPLAAAADGSVVMGAGKGWARVSATTATPAVRPWPSPTAKTVAGAQPQIAAATSTGKIITVWPIESDGKPQFAVYTSSPRGVQLAFRTPLSTVKEGQQLTWKKAADDSWGVIGQEMIDLNTGRVEPLGPATDLNLGVGRGCATIGTQRAVFGPRVPLGVMEAGEQCPAGVVDQTALLVEGQHLKALPAKGQN